MKLKIAFEIYLLLNAAQITIHTNIERNTYLLKKAQTLTTSLKVVKL